MSWRTSENQRYTATNLARTGVTDADAIRAKVLEAWVSYLLDNRARLPEGFMYGLDVEDRFDVFDKSWLQRHSALAVYELARNGWHYRLAVPEKGRDPVADWECGKASVEQHVFYLYSKFLQLVL